MQQYVLYQLIRWTRYQASFIKGLEGIFPKASFLCIFSFDCGAGYHRMIPPTIVRIPSAENLYLRMLPPLSRHVPAVGNLWMISPPLTLWNGIELKDTSKLSVLNFKMWHFYFAQMKKYLRVFIFLLHFALMMFAEARQWNMAACGLNVSPFFIIRQINIKPARKLKFLKVQRENPNLSNFPPLY